MPKGVYSDLDYTFKWAMRDNRPPSSWSADDRARRFNLVLCSQRWGDTLNNPYGPGKAVPGAKNLVTRATFYQSWNTSHPGTYGGAFGNDPAYLPPFLSQDSAAYNDLAAFPVGDDVGDWARYIFAHGLHDFSDDLASTLVESNDSQGWYTPAVRTDESQISGGKCFNPLWCVNFRKPGAGALLASYILANDAWADGILIEYYEPPDYYKNWAHCSYWTDLLTAPQRVTFSNEWRQGVLDMISALRAARPDWLILGQQMPYQGSSYQAQVNGFFRENNPGAFLSPRTNANAIANDQAQATAIQAAYPGREYASLWHVWHPEWVPGLGYYDERLGRFTANQTEHDSLIEHWKAIAAATPGAYMAIGDGGNATAYDMPWEGPSPRHVQSGSGTMRSGNLAGQSSLSVVEAGAGKLTKTQVGSGLLRTRG